MFVRGPLAPGSVASVKRSGTAESAGGHGDRWQENGDTDEPNGTGARGRHGRAARSKPDASSADADAPDPSGPTGGEGGRAQSTTGATEPAPDAEPSAAEPAAATAFDAPHGTFHYAEDQRPTSLLPFSADDMAAVRLVELLFDGLLKMDKRGTVVGALATAWKLDPDGRGETFTLREGVKWHDGQPFTADDVVFTIAAARDPGTAYVAKGRYTFITAAAALDTHHVHLSYRAGATYAESRLLGLKSGRRSA